MPTTAYRSSFQAPPGGGHGASRAFGGDQLPVAAPAGGAGTFGQFGAGVGSGAWKGSKRA